MSDLPRSPEKVRRYGYQPPGKALTATTRLHTDAADGVVRFARENGLSISGALHHLVRVALGLPPLPPLS